MDYDIERAKQSQTEIRNAFREMFPLASEHDLPWAACQIKGFLRKRIEEEAAEHVFHFVSQASRVLCEVTLPKTHFVDMCRIVVEEVKQARRDREKLAAAVEVTKERDELLARIRDIANVTGCNHTEDPDGRLKLVQCVQEVIFEQQKELDQLRP